MVLVCRIMSQDQIIKASREKKAEAHQGKLPSCKVW